MIFFVRIQHYGFCFPGSNVIKRLLYDLVEKLDYTIPRVMNSGPSCSKLTMSLVNDSLKFTSSDTQIC